MLKHYKKFRDGKKQYAELEAEEIQAKYVESIRDHPLYGTNFFHVKRHNFPEQMESFPKLCIIALNSEGLHFLNEEMETLSSYGYADIYRWGGSSTQFSSAWRRRRGRGRRLTGLTGLSRRSPTAPLPRSLAPAQSSSGMPTRRTRTMCRCLLARPPTWPR